MVYRGKYNPRNPEKYLGDYKNIIYRSGWECRVMSYLDQTPAVLAWKSEEIIIPYFDPTEGRHRRYFPDFWVRLQTRSGIKEMIWEIKPKKETIEPKIKKTVTKKYITEVTRYATNQAKWIAARAYCQERGWEFVILNEEHIFGKSHK